MTRLSPSEAPFRAGSTKLPTNVAPRSSKIVSPGLAAFRASCRSSPLRTVTVDPLEMAAASPSAVTATSSQRTRPDEQSGGQGRVQGFKSSRFKVQSAGFSVPGSASGDRHYNSDQQNNRTSQKNWASRTVNPEP